MPSHLHAAPTGMLHGSCHASSRHRCCTRSNTHLRLCTVHSVLKGGAQGVRVGEFWNDRLDCRQWGAHFPHVAGIAGQSTQGAQSVVLSGGYVSQPLTESLPCTAFQLPVSVVVQACCCCCYCCEDPFLCHHVGGPACGAADRACGGLAGMRMTETKESGSCTRGAAAVTSAATSVSPMCVQRMLACTALLAASSKCSEA